MRYSLFNVHMGLMNPEIKLNRVKHNRLTDDPIYRISIHAIKTKHMVIFPLPSKLAFSKRSVFEVDDFIFFTFLIISPISQFYNLFSFIYSNFETIDYRTIVKEL